MHGLGLYILDAEGHPVRCDDGAVWGQWLETATNRRVAQDDFAGDDGKTIHVSTVFLGLDHRFGRGEPLLWETMVFHGPLDGACERYASLADAVEGHQAMCARVKSGEKKLMTAEIVPLGDWLKVLPLRPASVTKGGIVLPEASEARDRPLEGLVLAVGRGRQLDSGALVPLECEVGDVVQFGRYAGIYTFDEVLGTDILLMREDEALGRKLSATVALVNHNGAAPHVSGDPRCEVCRAG